jgi:hypothetical protein
MVWEWEKDRGPVSAWSSALMNESEDANRNGTIDELGREWRAHADVGNAIAKDLRGFVYSRMPVEDTEFRDVLRQAFDLLANVLAVVAVIQAHLTTLDM